MTGEQLQEVRERLGLSRKDLAEAFGVTDGCIWSWENNGKRAQPVNKWVPLALAGMFPGTFKIFDGEIYIGVSAPGWKRESKPELKQAA